MREFLERAKHYAEAKTKGAEQIFDPRLEAMMPYVTGRLPVFFHTNSVRGIRTALQLSEQFGLKAVIAGGRDAWKIALEIVTNVHYLFIAGKPVPLESRHTRLYLQYRQRLRQPTSTFARQPEL